MTANTALPMCQPKIATNDTDDGFIYPDLVLWTTPTTRQKIQLS
jgi:hypothetical protein